MSVRTGMPAGDQMKVHLPIAGVPVLRRAVDAVGSPGASRHRGSSRSAAASGAVGAPGALARLHDGGMVDDNVRATTRELLV